VALIIKSHGNQWIISAEKQGEIEVIVGHSQRYPLRSLQLNRIDQAGNVDYEGSIEPWQKGDAWILVLRDTKSGRAISFSIVLDTTRAHAPPFNKITGCELSQGLRFKAMNVNWRW
jgi:hypothetical protein